MKNKEDLERVLQQELTQIEEENMNLKKQLENLQKSITEKEEILRELEKTSFRKSSNE